MRFLLCLAVTVAAVSSFSNESISSKQYSSELEKYQQRELNTREQIASEQSQVQVAKQQLENLNKRIVSLDQEKLNIVGVDSQTISTTDMMLSNLYENLQAFSRLSSENLIQKTNQIDSLEQLYNDFKSKKCSHLFRFTDKKNRIEQLLINLKNQFSVQVAKSSDSASEKTANPEAEKSADLDGKKMDSYIVKYLKGNRETLSKIAGYPEIYGDSKLWYKIYDANKKTIDENYNKFKSTGDFHFSQPQDYLIPGQVLIIPR